MVIDLLPLTDFETYDFEFELDKKLLQGAVDNLEFVSAVIVNGTYQVIDENTFTVDARICFTAKHICDLCAAEFEKDYSIKFLEAFTKDGTTDYVITKENYVDLGEAAREKVILAESGKRRLCKSNCKGLCDKCGANLNIEKCNCKVEKEDKSNPFAILKDKFNTGGH